MGATINIISKGIEIRQTFQTCQLLNEGSEDEVEVDVAGRAQPLLLRHVLSTVVKECLKVCRPPARHPGRLR